MKKTFMQRANSFGIIVFILGCAHSRDHVIHPVPQKPTLIDSKLHDIFRRSIDPPPAPGSEGQKKDEEVLRQYQLIRTQEDCARSKSEVFVSLSSMFGQPYGPLSGSEVEGLTPFFESIRNDGDYYIQWLKKEYPRKRPFLYLEGLVPCVPKEVTGAYPSGHATLARLFSKILANLYPTRKKAFEDRADQIARDRVLSGVHHPSDIEAGKQLGNELYQAMILSDAFNEVLGRMKKASGVVR